MRTGKRGIEFGDFRAEATNSHRPPLTAWNDIIIFCSFARIWIRNFLALTILILSPHTQTLSTYRRPRHFFPPSIFAACLILRWLSTFIFLTITNNTILRKAYTDVCLLRIPFFSHSDCFLCSVLPSFCSSYAASFISWSWSCLWHRCHPPHTHQTVDSSFNASTMFPDHYLTFCNSGFLLFIWSLTWLSDSSREFIFLLCVLYTLFS